MARKRKRTYSKTIDRVEDVSAGRVGSRMYDREQMYRFFFDNSDRYGIILYTQTELARLMDCTIQLITYTISDFVEMGLLVKHKQKWECMVDPEAYDWGEEFQRRATELARSHQVYYRNKQKENN